MGYRYQNNLNTLDEKRWLASLPRWRRIAYRAGEWGFFGFFFGLLILPHIV